MSLQYGITIDDLVPLINTYITVFFNLYEKVNYTMNMPKIKSSDTDTFHKELNCMLGKSAL